jgi:hypothetical protein
VIEIKRDRWVNPKNIVCLWIAREDGGHRLHIDTTFGTVTAYYATYDDARTIVESITRTLECNTN